MLLLTVAVFFGLTFAANEAAGIPKTPQIGDPHATIGGGNFKERSDGGKDIDLNRGLKPREIDGGINGLLDLVYTGSRANERPVECRQIYGGTSVYTCTRNQSPQSFKISSLQISPNPLMRGYARFVLVAKIGKDIAKGSVLYLDSFSDKNPIFSGKLDLCEHVEFANFHCPNRATEGFQTYEQAMKIPDDVPSGVYSFVARAVSAKGDELVTLVASIDLRSDLDSTIELRTDMLGKDEL